MKGSEWGFSAYCQLVWLSFLKRVARHLVPRTAPEPVRVKTDAARRGQQGFTIVETLVVLSVTGFLFAGAVIFVSGKQRNTEFSQAVGDVKSQVQQALGEVSSGYYASNGRLACTIQAGKPRIVDSAQEQGSNEDCIFMGKVLQFKVLGTNPEAFNVYTMVGLREHVTTSSVNIAAAKPRLAARTTGDPGNTADLYTVNLLRNGLVVEEMYYGGDPAKKIGAVGFASGLASLGMEDASQQVNIVAIPGTSLNLDKVDGVKAVNDKLVTIDTALAATVVNPAKGVQICFKGGGNKQWMLMTIGGSNRLNAVETQIKSGVNCT